MKQSVLLYLALLLSNFNTHAQADTAYVPGHICKVKIETIDKETMGPVALALIEEFKPGTQLLSGTTDLDGKLSYSICSNKLPMDSVTFKVTAVGYLPDSFLLKIIEDSLIVLKLMRDSLSSMTEKDYDTFKRTHYNGCGTDMVKHLQIENPKYRHCDGRIMSYQQLIDAHEKLEEWDRIGK